MYITRIRYHALNLLISRPLFLSPAVCICPKAYLAISICGRLQFFRGILRGIPNIQFSQISFCIAFRACRAFDANFYPKDASACRKYVLNNPHHSDRCDGRTERNRISDQSYPPPLACKVNILLNVLLGILPAFQFRPDPLIFVAPHFSQPAHDRPQARC